MSMKITIVSDFLKSVDHIVSEKIAANISAIAHVISPVFFAAVALYVVYIAWEIIYSNKEVVIGEVIKNMMLFTLIGAFTYTSPLYTTYVVPFVMHAGQDISAAVTGGTDTASTVDNVWDYLSLKMELFRKISTKDLSWRDVGGYIKINIIWFIGYVGGAILVFFVTIYLTVSTFMIGLLLSAGVIFICFAAFPSTRQMFTAWAGNCLNYILLNVFYSISFTFTLGFIDKFTKFNAKKVSLMDALALFVVILISVFLIEQIGTMCSALTGGVGINGLTSAISTGLGRMSKAGGAAARMAGKYSGASAFGRGFSGHVGKGMEQRGARAAARLANMAKTRDANNIRGG